MIHRREMRVEMVKPKPKWSISSPSPEYWIESKQKKINSPACTAGIALKTRIGHKINPEGPISGLPKKNTKNKAGKAGKAGLPTGNVL